MRKIIFASLLLLLLAMACVSASDADDIAIQTSDNASDVIASDEVNIQDSISISDENNILNARSFTDLQGYLNGADEGGILVIDDDYSLANGGHTLKIEKNLTIDGTGHFLNGNNADRILEIGNGAKTVVLKNITFKNGKSSGNGGAILNTHSSNSLTLIDCKFEDNYASDDGGAVYSNGKLSITDSKFTSNRAIIDGGAIYSKGYTTIQTSEFSDNTANGALGYRCFGGAIRSEGKCDIESTTFSDNYASNEGGAIYCDKELTICDSNFNSNKVDSATDCYGGAIYVKGQSHINGSKFYKNQAGHEPATSLDVSTGEGGAIYCKDKSYFHSCRFEHNYACDVGAAIAAYDDLTITGEGVFDKNQGDGGAIYCEKDIYINWNNDDDGIYYLSSNVAKLRDGGAIECWGNLYAKSLRVHHNLASGMEGAGGIYCNGRCNISSSSFWNNEYNTDYPGYLKRASIPGKGGAIYSNELCYIDSCSFEENWAERGGAIYASTDLYITGESSFKNNLANAGDVFSPNGGAIYCNRFLYIYNSIFTGNKVNGEGGAIYSETLCNVFNCKFEDNGAVRYFTDVDPYTRYGGAIRAKGFLNIENSSFSNNKADDWGGAIYNTLEELTIKGCNFTNNIARGYGAIFADTVGEISNSLFKENTAKGSFSGANGGAIYINKECNPKFTSCIFEENIGKWIGGAIHVDSSHSHLTISDCTFSNNIAYIDGGAIYCEGKTTISNSKFNGNKAIGETAKRSFGGAVRSNGFTIVKKSSFDNNFAYNHGGAIYVDADMEISDSNFTNNIANVDGGAVYCEGKTTISNSKFNGNKATGETAARSFGGAVRSNGLVTVTDCDFESNYADNRGGAIYANGEIRISSCDFEDNKARDYGGAVYASTIEKTVSHSIFIHNEAKEGDGGAIYINNDCDPVFTSCRFELNKADKRGGGMFLDSSRSKLTLTYCTFVDNTADKGQSVFDSGYYKEVSVCWLGENKPSLKDQFKIWHTWPAKDTDFKDVGYIKISMKVNETDLYVGNTYKVTVYFDSPNWNHDLLHSSGKFYGDGVFSNAKVNVNDMTADVVFTKENPTIYLRLDWQVVSLSPNVKYKDTSDVRILSCENVTYPNTIKVVYEIENMTDATYTIRNSQGIIVKEGKITNPKSTISIENLNFGKYSITINNKETRTVLPSNATANFSVYKLLNANITADNVTFGEYTTVTLNADTDGLYNVSFGIVGEDDRYTFEFEVVDGSCTRQIKLSPAGDYETHIRAGDYVVVNCTEALFTIYKANPNFKINVSKTDFYYGEDVLVNSHVVHPARGLVVYYINDEFYDISAAGITLELKNLNAGSYSVKAIYSGDINYLNDSDTLSFTVNRPQNNVVISVDNKTYGEKTYIEIHADVDGTYHVDVNGTVYDFNVCNGIGTDTFYFNAGVYYANVTFDNDNYNTTIQNTTFQIYKANVDLMIVVFDEIYPDEAECIIYASRDGEYNLTIEDYSTIVTVKDNIAYFEHSFPVGTYLAAVSFEGDNNYNKTYAVTTFTVYPEGTIFELEVHPNVITYGETATVTHTLSDGATGTIKYYLRNGTFLGELDVSENLTLPVLDIGYYVIIGNYSGANGFIPVTDSTLLTVKQAQNNVVVSVSNVTYGEDTLIEISANADGIYQLDLNGTIYNITVSNGVGNKSIALNTGKYYANISFYNKNYNTTIKNAVFEVYKADTHISIVALNITYPQELKGIIHSDVDGDYNLTVGTYSTIIPVENGQGEFNLGILDTGSYLIVANYSGDSNHNPAGYSLTITVNPALNNVIVTADNVTYGKDTQIEISADTDGIYQLDLNGTIYNITVVNGTGNKSIALDAGKYYANVTFNNKNYNTTIKNATFEVYKAATDIFVVGYHTIYPQEIEGIVYSNVDGEYNLTIGDYSTVIVVEHGRAKFNAGVFDAGNYTVTVTYKGDRNHMSNSSSDNFTVDAFHPDVTLSVSDIDYGGVAIIRITCDVAGYVNVTVNGITETLELNGQTRDLLFATADNVLRSEYTATLRLYNLDPGSYPVTVVYNGDRNFDNTTATEEFKVNRLNSTIDIKTKDINVGDDETITVKLISNATGTVTVSIDGKNYTATVKDGKAIITIPNLSAGDKTADVYYSGDKYYNPNMTTASFTVKKLKPNMSIDSNEPYSGEKIHIVVKLPADATGTVTITLEGKNYTAPVKDGKAIFDIPGLPAGKYNIKVYYSGDDKYEATEMDSIIIVKEQKVNPINNTPTIIAAGNPILLLVLVLMTIATTTIRRFKK